MKQRPIGDYIVDFYCASKKLVIEIDGDSHYSTKGEEYDRISTERLQKLGLTIIRFTNTDVINHFEGVCCVIQDYLKEIHTTPLHKGGKKDQ